MIKGLNHITVAVKNLDRSFQFYSEVLGFKPLMRHSKGAYFLAGDLWFCLDLDLAQCGEPLPEYTHFAFSVDQADFQALSDKIASSGAKIWKDNKSEGDSLYFLDPDGHKLEIHVGDWKSRLDSVKRKPWNESVVVYENDESEIQAMSPSHWPSIIDVAQSLPQWFTPTGIRNLSKDIRHQKGYVFFGSDLQIAGFITYFLNQGIAQIGWMGVDPRWHRRSIGSALLRKLEAQLIGEGVEELLVSTLGDSVDYEPYARTRAFYRKNDFEDCKRFFHADNPECEEELILRKQLVDKTE